MGPGLDLDFFIFSGSFLGTPFAPKTLFFEMKNQHFEVHFGVQNGVPPGGLFSYFLGSQVYGSMMSILGSSWGHLGPSWGHLGPSWGHLGPSWGHLGVILGRLGAIMGRLGAIFFHFFGFIFWNLVCSENAIICKEKLTF